MATAQTNNPGVPSTGSQLMSSLGTAQQLFGIYGDVLSGSAVGYTAAAASAAQLAAKNNLLGSYSSTAGKVGGDVSSALGIYSGLKQGGVTGDLQAAASGAKLASQLGSQTGLLSSSTTSVLGTAAGVVGAGLDIYNEIKGWQSGATGSDALAGAESGAAVGSIVPGIGTAIGAVVGAAVGALSSLFGGGKTDQETVALSKVVGMYGSAYAEDPTGAQAALATMSPAQSFQLIAGAFDAKNNSPGHSQALEQTFGRMQEGTFLTSMATQINQAVSSGKIAANATPGQVYASVVQPWINSVTNGAGIQGPENGEGGVLTGAVQNLIGAYMGGTLTSSTAIGAQGQAATTLPAYAGAQAAKSVPAVNHATIQPYTSAVLDYPGSSSSSTGSMLPVLIAMPAVAGAAGVTTGASTMADPVSGASNAPTAVQGTDPNAAATAASSSSSLGSDISSIGSDLSSFLSSPAGNLAEFGTLAGLGISQANSQKSTNDQLAASLGTIGQPYTAAGAAELNQLQGGAQVAGPLGASIAQQTSAAANLGQVANEYSTGQMTPAQQQQVSDYVKQQRAMVDTQLASSGNADSSAKDAAYQQIDDNAAQLGQSLIGSNTTMATQALSAVQSTYSNLLNQSLSEASFGFGTQEAAVQTQIASDTQLAASLNSLFAGLAQGFGTALGGSSKSAATGGTTAGQAAGQAAGSAVKAATSGGVSSSAAGGGTGTGDANTGNYNAGTAPDLGATDFSTSSLFGNTTPGFDTSAVTGTTPSFDTGFMDNSANPFGSFGDLSSSSTTTDFSSDPWS
jgi:hypothetical protein